jgi:DNA-binding response OmpR family regulator
MTTHSRARGSAETEHVGRILVIAEAFEIVDAVTEYFANLGYEAHGAIDGGDTLAIVRRSAPELILLDVPVARLSDLFRQLRAAYDIPIIIATEHADTARELRPLGAFAYIHKPFDWDDLRRRVAMVIYSALRSGRGTARP